MKREQKSANQTVSFVSLGCFKNTVDSEVLAGMLEHQGMELVSEYENPDWLVINTCGFIRDAKEESLSEILAALERKERGEIRSVAVFGCLIQRYHRELRTTFAKADVLWGVNDMEELAKAIAGNRPAAYPDRKPFLYSHSNQRSVFTTRNTSFIKISEGCNMTCSFCAIPQIRGPFRSRTIHSIMKEAEALKARGVDELNLISQSSTHFGKDRGKKSQLPSLLKEISGLGFRWLRVLYLMPEEVTPEILDSFALPTVLPYFDLPFQHVAPAVLNRMNRSGGYQRNLLLVREIRRRFPAAVLRSTFIVGFPGESSEDYRQLAEFCAEAALERIGVFAFSPEENTASFDLPDRKRPAVIDDRRRRLLDIGDRNLRRFNKALAGRILDFLPLATWNGDQSIGRVWAQAPEVDGHCLVQAAYSEDGPMYAIRIRGFSSDTLHGEKT